MSDNKFSAQKLRQAWGAGAASSRGTAARFATISDGNGHLCNFGELKSFKDGVAEVAIVNPMSFALLGMYDASGEVMRVAEDRIRMFDSLESVLNAAREWHSRDMANLEATS